LYRSLTSSCTVETGERVLPEEAVLDGLLEESLGAPDNVVRAASPFPRESLALTGPGSTP
jgi:hypothetical protein